MADVEQAAKYPGVQEFLFSSGLYATVETNRNEVFHLLAGGWTIDGYCLFCGQPSIFAPSSKLSLDEHNALNIGNLQASLEIVCSRDSSHTLWFEVAYAGGVMIQKIGQRPPLADIASDETKKFLTVLSVEDKREFNRAVGLATHGIGIGSFVYLRRVFERLVNTRFKEFQTAESWNETEFLRLRMDERVKLLSKHLPDFLVRNRAIYRILSVGIHELKEEECLAFFSVLKTSIIVILEEDKKKKEDLAQQKELESAISKFSARPSPSGK